MLNNLVLKIFMLFFICASVGNAQEIDSTHKVSRGETILDIAKIYNVTPYDIQQANPNLKSLDAIKEHDVLIIPQSKIKRPNLMSSADAIKSSVVSQSYTYTVKKGETKYGLSIRFGMTIPELEALNPQIIPGLNEGHVLRVNSLVKNITDEENSDTNKVTTKTYEGYKTHLVLKGETLYGISKTNGLTVDELVDYNSDVHTGVLKEGQVLKIPHLKQDSYGSFNTHIVAKGETKYGLSKQYQTTIEALERINPHIKSMLQEGHVLKIPSNYAITKNIKRESTTIVEQKSQNIPNPVTINNETVSTSSSNTSESIVENSSNSSSSQINTQTISNTSETKEESVYNSNQDSQPAAYSSYEIKPKETLYSLSKKAGITIPELISLNPQLKESVQIGTIIKMPATVSGTTEKFVNPPSIALTTARYANLSKTINTDKNNELLFVLPFTHDEFNSEKADSKTFNSVKDEFKRNHLEFYSGAIIALDSLKKLGLKIDIKILETENSKQNSKFTSILKDGDMTDTDAIILPFYGTIEADVAAAVAQQNIPVITAATIVPQQTSNNLFNALPSINQQRIKLLDYMISKGGNIIVVSDINRIESKDFIEAYVPYAKFVEVKKNGNYNEDDLMSKLKTDQLNFVILDSERNSVFLNVTNTLLSELNAYNLQLAVLESSLIPDSDDVSEKRYRILKMLVPSLSPALSNLETNRFSRSYQNVYDSQPTTNALLGFDITFDTLLRLAQDSNFETTANNAITEYTKLKFNYQRKGQGGYNNEGIYILQYDTDLDLKEVN